MNKPIKFAEWIAESHFRLYNIENNLHYWGNSLMIQTTEQLYDMWIKECNNNG